MYWESEQAAVSTEIGFLRKYPLEGLLAFILCLSGVTVLMQATATPFASAARLIVVLNKKMNRSTNL